MEVVRLIVINDDVIHKLLKRDTSKLDGLTAAQPG